MVVLAWFFREPLLRSAAQAWIVNDPVPRADAVVVLGGGADWRPFAAADMYLAGHAPVVLVAHPEPSPSQVLLHHPSEAEIYFGILTNKGVPASAILPFGQNVTSTRDEAAALRDWVLKSNARDIIIPTDPFHTRRARWIFTRALEGTGVTVHVQSVAHPRYDAGNWWQREEGFLGFQNELLKTAYYLLNY